MSTATLQILAFLKAAAIRTLRAPQTSRMDKLHEAEQTRKDIADLVEARNALIERSKTELETRERSPPRARCAEDGPEQEGCTPQSPKAPYDDHVERCGTPESSQRLRWLPAQESPGEDGGAHQAAGAARGGDRRGRPLSASAGSHRRSPAPS